MTTFELPKTKYSGSATPEFTVYENSDSVTFYATDFQTNQKIWDALKGKPFTEKLQIAAQFGRLKS